MTARHLLDANVLIALAVAEHVHHDRASAWLARNGSVALCPTTEGALARFIVRAGERPAAAGHLLNGFYASGMFEFWPDDLSYADLSLTGVRGHQQVTDAYLAALADRRGARLATLDEGLAQAHPGVTSLLPAS